MHLALDKATGDLIISPNGGVERVTEGRFIVQQVQSKLRTWLGEWVLDPSVGWLNLSDFEKNYNITDLELRARQIILGTQGVFSIISMESKYSKRKLTIQFKANTKYGTIDLTIPWGN
tara:strand:- start:15476 stop:15829 length:354 start_codon:yes stop_codon:yes gene_type:complete